MLRADGYKTGTGVQHGLWTIVLAGGDGVRLRELTQAVHGEELPKQFAMLQGGRSLLQATVARCQRWSALQRIVIVVASEREALARAQLRTAARSVDIVAQPLNRGTGPGLLLALARVMARDPGARVAVVPSDHYVRDEAPFERSIRLAASAAEEHVTLVGAVPEHGETQYGWIVTGCGRPGDRSRTVERFCEKPSAALAERLLRTGALWNTFVMVGAAQRFWSLGTEYLPAAMSLFEAYRTTVDTEREAGSLREIYRDMPMGDFSRDVLQSAKGLRAVPLEDCGWSDWGTPERVLESLRCDHYQEYSKLARQLSVARRRFVERQGRDNLPGVST